MIEVVPLTNPFPSTTFPKCHLELDNHESLARAHDVSYLQTTPNDSSYEATNWPYLILIRQLRNARQSGQWMEATLGMYINIPKTALGFEHRGHYSLLVSFLTVDGH